MDQPLTHDPDLHGPRRRRLSFLRPDRVRRSEEEKREDAARRQQRYVEKLISAGDAPATSIGLALLASLATAEKFDAALDAPIVRAALEKLQAAGCSIPLVHRRIKSLRKRLKQTSPGDAAERRRRREAKPHCAKLPGA